MQAADRLVKLGRWCCLDLRSENVTDVHDPDDEGIADSVSPAKRIGDALSDWLHGYPRVSKSRFEPVEIVLFAIVVGIAFIIVAAVSPDFGGSNLKVLLTKSR